jgi:hypothetical protein
VYDGKVDGVMGNGKWFMVVNLVDVHAEIARDKDKART